MKKLILIFTILSTFLLQATAQLTDGSIAPNWILTDLNGETHELQNYLDNGKTVLINFMSTQSSPYWNYHNQGNLKDLYLEYGPDGTDQIMVFMIDADPITSDDDLNGTGNNTLGNWVTDTPFPIINLADQATFLNYNINYLPTNYGICQDGYTTEYSINEPISTLEIYINGCAPTLSIEEVQDETCFEIEDGFIDLKITGGVEPYSFSWSNGSTSEDIGNLAQGIYTCTITDNHGTVVVSDEIMIAGPSTSLMASTTITDEGCEGEAGGTVDLNITGGTSPYEYFWHNGSTDEGLDNLSAGTYAVTVTDANDCTTTLSNIIIEAENLPTLDAGIDLAICEGENATITATGAQNYSWSSGETTASITVMPSVTTDYIVSTTGTNGCTNTDTIQVKVNELPIATAESDSQITCSTTEVTIDGDGSSTGNNVNYQWSTDDGNIVSEETNLTITADAAGTYTLTVTNNLSGCSTSTAVEIQEDVASPQITATGGTLTCNNSSIQLEGVSTNLNSTFSWTGPNGFTSDEQNPTVNQAGEYTLTVISENGCQASTIAVVEEDAEVPMVTITGGTLTCNNPSIQLEGASTSPNSTFSWTGPNGFTSDEQNPTVNQAGEYTLTVISENGCQASASLSVGEDISDPLMADFTFSVQDFTVNFMNVSIGNIESFQWDFGDGTISSDNNPTHIYAEAGTYECSLVISNSCEDDLITQTIIIESTPPINNDDTFTFIVDTIYGSSQNIVQVPVRVRNFNNIFGFQKSIQIADTTLASFQGIGDILLDDLAESSFIVEAGSIRCAWFAQNQAGYTIDDNEIIYYLDVLLKGGAGECTSIMITDEPLSIQVISVENNNLSIIEHQIVDGSVCTYDQFSFSGRVAKEDDSPVSTVDLVCGDYNMVTEDDGLYYFNNMVANEAYIIEPSRATAHNDGVSIFDIVQMQQHILNTFPLDSPYKIIAADVNHDENVTVFDLVITQQLLLGDITEFPDNTSWRFVPTAYQFTDENAPLDEDFPEQIEINPLLSNMEGLDFVAIKIGDVTLDASNLTDIISRSTNTLNFHITDQALTKDRQIKVDFTANDFQHISGIQFELNFDQHVLAFDKVEGAALSTLNISRRHLDNGSLTALWYDVSGSNQGVNIQNDDVLFSVYFNVLTDSKYISEHLDIHSKNMQSIAYNNTGDILKIGLQSKQQEPVKNKLVVYPNHPNPFKEETTIAFELPIASQVDLLIMDASGKMLEQYSKGFVQGYNEFNVSGKIFLAPGIYYYQLRTNDQIVTKKMTVLK